MGEQVKTFHARQIEPQYAFVYLDATYLPLRHDPVAKDPVHIALGITGNGKKEILGYKIAPTESLTAYQDLLRQLKSQGLTQVLMFLSDGFKEIEGVIHEEFPAAKHQHCLVHLSRNLWSPVRVGHREALAEDFKAVYQSRSREAAQAELEAFIEKCSKNYPRFKKSP